MQKPNARVPGQLRTCPGIWEDSALQSPAFSCPWSHVLDKVRYKLHFDPWDPIFAVTQGYFLFVLIDLH